jgi:NADH:ubiquinone oxidoreductase subunit F (NADH-binding)/(2Fe-2S) ferredoxin
MAKAYRIEVMACTGTGCVSNGSYEVIEAMREELKKRNLESEVEIVATGCNGICALGPIMVIKPDNIFYKELTKKDVPYLVEEHFLKGRPVKKFMYTPPEEKEPIPLLNEINFFTKQVLIALRNRGLVDPELIEDYIARDGYAGFVKAITKMTPEQVIQEITLSGLRGRGGAGFPTGLKWQAVRNAKGDEKFLICNGDEGDPGAFMDRSIVESDPHSVIEGMLIGAYAVGAKKGFVYIRNEYPLAVKRIEIAINQAREKGLLGENILGLNFDFDIKVVRGAGAFVCGEETALIASVEGRLGEPRPRPPYPAEKGLWDKPTCINNVETWATVPVIINRGAKWFSSMGTATSKGTKVFSLVGKVNNTGLIEVPMGITLREIIYDIGGGIIDGRQFKAVQTGGPSGGCIPASQLDLPIDYESLTAAGSMMGSGGMVVMDDSTCMVDIARYFLSFTAYESCGKCTPCREGTYEMLKILERICRGEGKPEDLETLETLSYTIKEGSLCGLGKTAPNPVISTMRYFRDEYESHIFKKKCPAKTCRKLNTYVIDEERCLNVGHGCDICRKECAYEAIIGQTKQAHRIIQEKCTKCGSCYDVCKFNAININ